MRKSIFSRETAIENISLNKQKHGNLEYHCESDNAIFAWRVTWNYAYNPFNQTYQQSNRAF